MVWAAVLDSCVLVPGALRDDLLSIASAGLYRPIWSPAILEEVSRTLTSRFGLAPDRVAWTVSQMEAAFPDASDDGWLGRLPGVPSGVDAGDAHVVAAALATRAHTIVTENVKHFAVGELAAIGVEVKRPDDFLVDQWTISPRQAAVGVRHQLLRLDRSPQAHVEAVSRRLPRFGEVMALDLVLLTEPAG